METRKEAKLIDQKELKNWLGRPVWYQSLTDLNDFGWTFVHPDTVRKNHDGSPVLGYCKLIQCSPAKKDWYSWGEVRIYSKPKIHGICYFCQYHHKGTLTHCIRMEQGEKPDCSWDNKYKGFEPSPYFRERNYSVKTFIRAIKLSGYQIRKEANNA